MSTKITVSASHINKELAKAAKILKEVNELIEDAHIAMDISMISLGTALKNIEQTRVAIRNKSIVAAVEKYSSARVAQYFGVTAMRVSQIAPRKK